MGRHVAGAHTPLLHAVASVAIQIAGVHIVAGVAYIEILGDRVHHNAVWRLNLGVGAIGDDVVAHHTMLVHVNDAVFCAAACRCSPVGIHHIQRVAVEPQVAHAHVQLRHHALLAHIVALQSSLYVHIVASTGYPQPTVMVGNKALGIQPHFNFVNHSERVDVNHRQAVLVVWRHISAAVSHIDAAAGNLQAVGLKANHTLRHHLQRSGVDLCHISQLLVVGIDDHRTGIAGDVGITLVELDKTAIRYVNLPDALGGGGVHHLHLVRHVHHGIQSAAIHRQVVAHVAKFLGHRGVGVAIYVAGVDAGGIVVVVERAFVAAHIALVEQIEALHRGVFRRAYGHILGDEYHIIFAARCQGKHHRRKSQCNYVF